MLGSPNFGNSTAPPWNVGHLANANAVELGVFPEFALPGPIATSKMHKEYRRGARRYTKALTTRL